MPYFDEETDAVLIAQWDDLGKEVRDAITTESFKLVVDEAVASCSLNERERNILKEEVLFTLLGLQTPKEFEAELGKIQNLTMAQALSVLEYIRKRLFIPLHIGESSPAAPQATASPLKKYVDEPGTAHDRFLQLPETVRETILSVGVGAAFMRASNEAKLNATQRESLARNTVLVTVGIANTKDFGENIGRELGIQAVALTALLQGMEQGVFRPVREAIVRALEARKANAQPVASAAAGDNYRESV